MNIAGCLKRKRPPNIEIPSVLREVQIEEIRDSSVSENDAVSFCGIGVGVCAVKGKKKFMEDTHKIVSSFSGKPNSGFFGVYDGHGGRKAAEFVAENLHHNIIEMLNNSDKSIAREEAVGSGYLKTDREFLEQGIMSGACCVTTLIDENDIIISNLGDCRAVLCRGGVAEALTRDHTPGEESERKRIEEKGGFVELHRGAWRIHGVLSISRSIGDAHLKEWVIAEPDTKILRLTPDMEYLVLASDGLWGKVGNQEVVDVTKRLCLVEKKQTPRGGFHNENDGEFGLVSTSPSSKIKRISLLKQCTIVDESGFGSENGSSPSKVRRVSLAKQTNIKLQSPIKGYRKRAGCSGGLVAACEELVKLAVSRGSLDDITVMIIDLSFFQFN